MLIDGIGSHTQGILKCTHILPIFQGQTEVMLLILVI
jgi:hypothetical protein